MKLIILLLLFPLYLSAQEIKNIHGEIIFSIDKSSPDTTVISVDAKQVSVTIIPDIAGNAILFVKTRQVDNWFKVKGFYYFKPVE